MQTIIHLSDLHIGLSAKETRNAHKIVEIVDERYPEAMKVITGDITDSGTTRQFMKASGLLFSLDQALMVPGNHDYCFKGNFFMESAWKRWMSYFGEWMGPDAEPLGIDGLGVHVDGPMAYIGVDSGDPNDEVITARGYISKELAGGLKKVLEEYKHKTRVVFLHHHPFTWGWRSVFTKLDGSDKLMRAVKGRCELLLFGHEHEYGLWHDKWKIPLIVSSHKSPEPISGNTLAYTVIDIKRAGTKNVSFEHRLEVC